MIKEFKYKIITGFLLLVLLLVIAAAVSIREFLKLSNSVDALIEDNYKTILASREMIEAIEREDSGILLLLLGQWEEGRTILEASDSIFLAALAKAENNITEPREEEYIQRIRVAYREYKQIWLRPIVDTEREGNIIWYQQNIRQKFLESKQKIYDLMTLNENSMYQEASNLKDKSRRAIMPDIIAIIAALVFSVLLNFFISKYYLSPLNKLTESIKKYQPGSGSLRTDIDADREITRLEEEISHLIDRYIKHK